MKWKNLQLTSDSDFRRVVGVKRATFVRMVEILQEAQKKKKSRGGRPNKLTIEEMLLMALEYLREYRTYAHIGMSYGLSESNTYYAVRWIEDTLIKTDEFKLPGKKALLSAEKNLEVVLIDATESPIERPKKNNANSIQEKRSDIQSKLSL